MIRCKLYRANFDQAMEGDIPESFYERDASTFDFYTTYDGSTAYFEDFDQNRIFFNTDDPDLIVGFDFDTKEDFEYYCEILISIGV